MNELAQTLSTAGARGQAVSDTVNLSRYSRLLKHGLQGRYVSRIRELDNLPCDENDLEPDEFNVNAERLFVIAVVIIVLAVVLGDLM